MFDFVYCQQVAVIAPNIPALYEAHFAVPMSGAVVNCVIIDEFSGESLHFFFLYSF